MSEKKSAEELMQEALAAFGAGEVDLKTMLGPQPRDNNPSKVYGLMDCSGSMGGYEDSTRAAMKVLSGSSTTKIVPKAMATTTKSTASSLARHYSWARARFPHSPICLLWPRRNLH